MTAAFATCIYDYLKEKGITDYSKLLTDSDKYYEENIFYLYSFDLSGIQKFIYTVINKKALKSLRTRSFYLEILLEDIIDTLLERLRLSRMNVIYSGGGHCYFILPNTDFVKDTIELFKNEINNWFVDTYGIELYLAGGGKECNARVFNSENSEEYTDLFRGVSEIISENKLKRYDLIQLEKLNFLNQDETGRECKICNRIEKLEEKNEICSICDGISNFSNQILEAEFFVIEKNIGTTKKPHLIMPLNKRLISVNKLELLDKIQNSEEFIRAYTKNDNYSGEGLSTKLWVGDYYFDKELSIFSEGADGINRLGVIRADVDNLGRAFVKGFSKDKVSLTRSAVFSRNMSIFFKYHINYILENGKYSLTEDNTNKNRKAMVVYSGGDDLFVVGAWNDIIEFSLDLVESLDKFTLGALELSAGLGIYNDTYPIKSMALETGKLEDYAKLNEYIEDGVKKEKNSICIFDKSLVFSWKEFREKVIEDKLKLLINYFGQIDDKGKAFLYKILDFLRESRDKLNIARLAYLLARVEPKDKNKREAHESFSKNIYKFALDENEKKELIAAIYMFVYLERR